MATPSQLVSLIAKCLLIPETSVVTHDRNLASAGLRRVGGRGKGAAAMSPRDATNLLLAVTGSRNIKDSATTVDRPGALVSTSGRWTTDFVAIEELMALQDDHTFADGLEALIAAAASGTLQAAAERLEGGPVDLAHDMAPSLNIEVTIYGPTPRGAIQIEEIVTGNEGGHYRYKDNVDRHFYGNRRVGVKEGNLAWMDVSRPKEMDSDLRTSATFTHRTIAAVGQLLARK